MNGDGKFELVGDTTMSSENIRDQISNIYEKPIENQESISRAPSR